MQRSYLARAVGVARFAYNWALTEWGIQYAACKADPTLPRPSEAVLRRQLNAIKREQFPWMLDVTKCAPPMAIMQLGRAFDNFFVGRARYPTYRRKGVDDRVTISNDQFQVDGKRLRIPKLARLHERITHRRREGLHQLTTSLTRRFHTIGIEDLNVKGILRNRKLARAIVDMGFYEFRRQLMYKAAQRGGQVILVDRWYPSSKMCCGCGHVLEALTLAQRNWTCPDCGAAHNRDVNAAVNLMNMAVSSIVTACGGKGAGVAHKRHAKPVPMKQESNVKANYD